VNIKKIFSVEKSSATPQIIMNHNNHTGVEPSESCVCKEVFTRHSPLSLPFRIQSGHHIRIRNIEKGYINMKNVAKSLLLPDSIKDMKELTLERHTLYESTVEKTSFV
jgi:hypothetical protein